LILFQHLCGGFINYGKCKKGVSVYRVQENESDDSEIFVTEPDPEKQGAASFL
jgi:hypothetical protein